MVTIYSKNNCVQCKMTKRFLDSNHVEYREINLDEQPQFVEHVKSLGFNAAPVIQTPDEVFSLPRELIPKNKEIFTLKVSGESMINVGIFDRDILIVERTNVAKNGDTVVAMNEDNEATVKTFYKENGYFRLQPENDTMQPIILKTVTILGKVIGLYRKF